MSLKIKKSTYLHMDNVRAIAKNYNIIKDMVDDCLHFFRDVGEILWYENIPALKDIIFQRPRKLVYILKGVFSHKLEETLDFTDNRIFSSKGQFTHDTFLSARHQLTTCGEISRPMLLCLWFYLHLDLAMLDELLKLLPHLDLCYTIPQPEVPCKKNEFFPLMVVPFYNVDSPPDDMTPIWPPDVDDELKEVELSLTFPLLYPTGLFERLSCRLQEKLSSRTDWRDTIFTEFFSGRMLITRQLDEQTYDCVLRVRIRGDDMNFLKNTMGFVYRELGSLLGQCSGLVWYKKFGMENCDKLTITDCFPKEVLMSD